MEDDTPRNNRPYEEALHAVQAGVGTEQGLDRESQEKINKHLRVGLNSAMVTDAALVRLLVKKGLLTREEYAEEVRLEMNREVDRYEDGLSARLGRRVTLV